MSRTSTKKDDPLAGWRDRINRGEVNRLLWPDTGQGAPVEEGQVFDELRSCAITITKVHRVQKGRKWMWRAEFTRHVPHRRFFPTGSATRPYTHYPEKAERSPEDYDNAASLVKPDDRRPPSEAMPLTPPADELVAPHELADLPSSVAAQTRYLEIHNEDIQKRLDRSMTSKLREVRVRARQVGADVSTEMEVIAEATESARRKVRKAAA